MRCSLVFKSNKYVKKAVLFYFTNTLSIVRQRGMTAKWYCDAYECIAAGCMCKSDIGVYVPAHCTGESTGAASAG